MKKKKVGLDRNYIVAQKASSSLTILRVLVLCDLDDSLSSHVIYIPRKPAKENDSGSVVHQCEN